VLDLRTFSLLRLMLATVVFAALVSLLVRTGRMETVSGIVVCSAFALMVLTASQRQFVGSLLVVTLSTMWLFGLMYVIEQGSRYRLNAGAIAIIVGLAPFAALITWLHVTLVHRRRSNVVKKGDEG